MKPTRPFKRLLINIRFPNYECQEIIEREYKIGEAFMSGEKRKALE